MERKMNQLFTDKTLLITGGTGSFGNAILSRFLESDIKEIRIFSRDEKKQDDMRIQYKNTKIKFIIGDVRDDRAVLSAMNGVNYVFHAAALKQVPSCEFFPLEAIKTNVLGTENVLNAAILHNVERVICLSTDKAVYPINAMGMSKALMEKVAISKARSSSKTIINVTRYGNVMASRGSVIPLFVDQILNNKPITITDPEMTRFMMTLDDAVDLVLYAFQNGTPGELFVQKAPAATVKILGKSLSKILSKKYEEVCIGTRHGEKLYEVLLSSEEMATATDIGRYFSVKPDNRDLNYSAYTDVGSMALSNSKEYNSHNTHRLEPSEMHELLLKLPLINQAKMGV